MTNPEKSLIALLLNYPEYYSRVLRLPNVFYDRVCRYIFNIIKKQVAYDHSTVWQVAQKNITEIQFNQIYEYYFEEDNLDAYVDFILSKDAKIKAIEYLSKLKRSDYVRYDIIKDDLGKIITDINKMNDEEIETPADVILRSSKEDGILKTDPIMSNISYIDNRGGLESTDLLYIGARTTQGKTTYALNLIKQDIESGIDVGFFTTEVNNKKIIRQLACMKARVEEWKLRTNNLTEEETKRLERIFADLYEKNLLLDGTSRLEWNSLKRKAIKMVSRGAKKIYIDYLQRIMLSDNRYKSRYEVVTRLSELVKNLAHELNTPIICLVQLNRNCDAADREPELRDLRDSGNIEQDGDIIILLYHETKIDDTTINIKNLVRKYRNGPAGHYKTIFDLKLRQIKEVVCI